jgi:hypothetical protein
MFEKFRKYIGPAALFGTVAVIGANGGVGPESNHPHEQLSSIENVETVYYQAQPGSTVVLDLEHEIPPYRLPDIQNGTTQVGVVCAMVGSNQGDIDSQNVIIPYGKLTEKDIRFKLPIPGKEYDGSSGYGYFIICGKEGVFTNKGIEVDGKVVKPDFSKRIVYLVTSNSKIDNRKIFAVR